MPKISQHSAESKNTRRVLLLKPLSENLSPEQDVWLRDLQKIGNSADNLLQKSIAELERVTSLKTKRLNIECVARAAGEPKLSDCVGPSDRIIIDCVHTKMDEIPADHAPSHLVAFDPNNDCQPCWSKGAGSLDLIVTGPDSNLTLLAHDIAFDIVMYYAWQHNIPDKEFPSGSEFSKLKVKYAQDNNLEKTYYGQITDWEIGYYSFAAAVRKSKTFRREDLLEYYELWKKFILHFDPPDITDIPTPSEISKNIISSHIRGNQISYPKLVNAVSNLSPGMYTLVMTTQPYRPKKLKIRNSIAALFGKKKWRANYWRIVPSETEYIFAAFHYWLKFFRFPVPGKIDQAGIPEEGVK